MLPPNTGRTTLLFLLLVVLPIVWASVRLYRHDGHGISNTTLRAAFRRYGTIIVAEAGIFALVVLGVVLAQGQSLLSAGVNAAVGACFWVGINMLMIAKFNSWK